MIEIICDTVAETDLEQEVNTSADNIFNSEDSFKRNKIINSQINQLLINASISGPKPNRISFFQRELLKNLDLLESEDYEKKLFDTLKLAGCLPDFSFTIDKTQNISDKLKNRDYSSKFLYDFIFYNKIHNLYNEIENDLYDSWIEFVVSLFPKTSIREEGKLGSSEKSEVKIIPSFGLDNEKIVKAKLKYTGEIQPNKTMKDCIDYLELEDL